MLDSLNRWELCEMRRLQLKQIVIFAFCLILICTFVLILFSSQSLQLISVRGKDMEPTLHEGDRIVVTTRIEQLRRGDIVIFRYPGDSSKNFIKRVVGLPGELIEITEGKVLINGQALQEEYLDSQLNRSPYEGIPTRVAEGEYFVMGDNRDNSNDSRFWGPLSRELIQSRVVFHK